MLKDELIQLQMQHEALSAELNSKNTAIIDLNRQLNKSDAKFSEIMTYLRVYQSETVCHNQTLSLLEKPVLSDFSHYGRAKRSNMLFEEKYGGTVVNPLSAWWNPSEICDDLDGDAFSFYGSFVSLSRKDKVRALENEIVRDMKVQMDRLSEERDRACNDNEKLIVEFAELKKSFI